jgi:hypothetical protein
MAIYAAGFERQKFITYFTYLHTVILWNLNLLLEWKIDPRICHKGLHNKLNMGGLRKRLHQGRPCPLKVINHIKDPQQINSYKAAIPKEGAASRDYLLRTSYPCS